jgi:hypothetical protein
LKKAHDENVEWALKRANLGREMAKARLLDVSAPLRSSVMSSLKDMIKTSAVADPEMWPWVRKGFEGAIENFLDDLEHEIEGNLEAALLKQRSLQLLEGPRRAGPIGWYYKLRAFVLHHFLPHDKSIFGKLKDPVYLLMLLLTLLPFALLRVAFYSVVLAMIIFPGAPDEFQLMNFILLFKGSQFLNSGLMTMAKGSMKYFVCFSLYAGDMGSCVATQGPGASDSLVNAMIDYVGSVVLVWIAFRQLPYSEKHVQPKYVARYSSGQQEHKPSDDDCPEPARFKSASNINKFKASSDLSKGGRLAKLLWYDVKCFVLTLAVLVLVAVVTWREGFDGKGFSLWVLNSAHFKEDLFWCKVLYGILSLPFLPFSISFLCKVLTHCEYTGYNEHGACVAFDIPVAPVGDGQQHTSPVLTRAVQSPLDAVSSHDHTRTQLMEP